MHYLNTKLVAMKKIIFFACCIGALAALNSCMILSTKKYNAILAQRDSLSVGWDQSQIRVENLELSVDRLKADTSRLHKRLADLQAKYQGLDSNYTALRNNTSSEIKRLAEDLKKREARLTEVEEILKKRDEATNALKDKLQKALLGFQQNGLTVEIRNGKVYVSLTDKLLFDEKGEQALKARAKVLKTQPEIKISVEGHTDTQKVNNLGQIKDNWDLSVLRATSVVRYLTDTEKIESSRITATGKGEYQPVAEGSSPEIRSRNRRIEIVLSPKLDELYQLIK